MSRTKADWRVRASGVPASQVAIRTRLRAAAIRRPTSFGVRYSRGRRPAYGTCRGRTVPFSAVGMRAWAVQFSRERTPVRVPAVPFWVQNGTVVGSPVRHVHVRQFFGTAQQDAEQTGELSDAATKAGDIGCAAGQVARAQ